MKTLSMLRQARTARAQQSRAAYRAAADKARVDRVAKGLAGLARIERELVKLRGISIRRAKGG